MLIHKGVDSPDRLLMSIFRSFPEDKLQYRNDHISLLKILYKNCKNYSIVV